MKRTRILALLLAVCMLLVCCACGAANNTNNGGNSGNSNNSNQAEPKAPDAATAMDNFVKKLQAGNYVVDVKSFAKTTAVSPEIVYIDYYHEGESIIYAFMSVKGETFQVDFYGEEQDDVIFASPANAIETLVSLLPNYWIAACGGNMWDLFYNNVDDPLEFTSKETVVKTTLLALAGYNENALEYTEEVHARLDAEDPTSVHFTAKISDPGTMIHFDDLDITLQFGSGKSDPRIDSWLASPTYPPTRTAWTQADINMFDNVFMRGCGRQSVPFPKFASYAMSLDNDNSSGAMVRITDAHGTEQDVEDYKALLLAQGFEKAEGTASDGSTVEVYRKLLREEYRSYAQLYPYYDNGFVLEARRYNDIPAYSSLAEISEAIQRFGFAPLPDTDAFGEITYAADVAFERSEDYAYYFDYDLYLPVVATFSSIEDARAYLEAYGSSLSANGFSPQGEPGKYGGRYKTANGFTVFWFEFTELEDDSSVSFIFKHEKSLTVEETLEQIKAHGLPETEVFGDTGCRDLTRYRYEVSGFRGIFLEIFQPYDSTEKAEAYLNSYVPGLIDQGYLPIDPQKFNSYKPYLYYNDELRKYVAFDLVPAEDGASINYELFSAEDDDAGMMLNRIRH